MKSKSTIAKSKIASWYAPLKHPLQAVVVGLLLGGVIIALSGFNPFEAIIGMFKGGFGCSSNLSRTSSSCCNSCAY